MVLEGRRPRFADAAILCGHPWLEVLHTEPVVPGGQRAAVIGPVPTRGTRAELFQKLSVAVEDVDPRTAVKVGIQPDDVPRIVVTVTVGREERREVDKGHRP